MDMIKAYERKHGIKWEDTVLSVRACWADAWNEAAALFSTALEPFADIRCADTDAIPDSAGFAARRNGTHATYGDIRRARELLRSNAEVNGERSESGGLTRYADRKNGERT